MIIVCILFGWLLASAILMLFFMRVKEINNEQDAILEVLKKAQRGVMTYDKIDVQSAIAFPYSPKRSMGDFIISGEYISRI